MQLKKPCLWLLKSKARSGLKIFNGRPMIKEAAIAISMATILPIFFLFLIAKPILLKPSSYL